LFPPEVASALAKHVPWTRVVRDGKTRYRSQVVDLLPFAAQNRENMVLKPSGGAMGSGVLLGGRVTDAAWRAALKRALNGQYVVQERVFAASESYPSLEGEGLVLEDLVPTIEPFVWNGEVAAGAYARLSAKSMHTLTEGGKAPVWILDGPAEPG
jgi:hypothetical protein